MALRRKPITITCPICGKKKTVKGSRIPKTCSEACRYAYEDAGKPVRMEKRRTPITLELSYAQAVGIVHLMIKDAKEEMVRRRFDIAQSFLSNRTGGLEILLSSVPGVSLQAALFALYRFATVGWKTATESELSRNAA